MTKVLYARIPVDLHDAVTEVSERTGVPMSAVVTEILSRALGFALISIDDAIAERQITSVNLS